jgi:hypothetical protein
MRVHRLCAFALSSLIVASLFFMTFNASAAGTAKIYLNPATISSGSLKVGDTFDVTVQVSDVENLWQWVLGLSWDPSVLALQGSPVEGPFLKGGGSTLFAIAPVDNAGVIPEISSTLMSNSTASGGGVLATVAFKIVGYGSSNIDIVDAHLSGPPLLDDTSRDIVYKAIAFTSTGSTFNLPSTNPTSNPTTNPTNAPTTNPSTQPTTSNTTPTATSSATPVVKISPSSLQIHEVGETIQANIAVENVVNLWQWETSLSWDPATLNFTGIQEGPFLKSSGETLFEPDFANYKNGNLTVSNVLRSASSVNGSGVLATVTFNVLAVKSTTIQLYDTVLSEPSTGHPEIAHSSVNGDVIVAASFIASNLYPTVVAAIIAIIIIIAAVIVLKKKKKKSR